MKNLISILVIALAAYWLYLLNSCQKTLAQIQAIALQERQSGSVCLPVQVSDGRAGWSSNHNSVLELHKGEVFISQVVCEQSFQAATGESPSR